MFARLYHHMMLWAQHRHAPFYLAGITIAEASVFPIPPDFMLAPMVLASPKRSWQLAWLTTVCSVIGGILGYIIGYFFFELIGQVIIHKLGLLHQYDVVVHLFDKWGFGMILLAGITPIPYKLFTIAAGVSMMPFVPFVFGSFIGRMVRFFLVTLLVKKFGPAVEKRILKSIDNWGWVFTGLLVLIICVIKFI